MASGSLRSNSKDHKVKSTPEGDAWHHDLMAYLGGINFALAGLAFLRLAVLTAPDARVLSAFTTGSLASERPIDVLCFVALGMAHFSQARVNRFVVRNTGRWIMGKFSNAITVVDGLLTALDWVTAVAVARST
jgi:hypothetical protein